MSLKRAYKKNQFLISPILLVISAISLVIGLFGTILSGSAPGILSEIENVLGNWAYWLLLLGGLFTFIFSYVIIDLYRKLNEFNELFETTSKSKFIKNIARIETLALKLGPKYEDKVIEKEEDYNLDR
ncbi:MAG: DUF3198 domain-containing protein [Thermoplasmatota archaeon]